MSKAKRQSPDSGDTDDEYERQPNDLAVEFPDGVPATHRHEIRQLLHRFYFGDKGCVQPNVTKHDIWEHGTETTLAVYFDDGVISQWDVEYPTGRSCDEFAFQAHTDHVQIKLYK